ncbi:MAG TPA: hypothetical protein VEW26_01830 [Allosphingosinicella sp.]|nr:hypothetical protein [Allosphingosinicella sp.]
MTISHSEAQIVGYSILLALVLVEVAVLRRRWSSGVLEYFHHRVERSSDEKRFRFWFIADCLVLALVALAATDWIARQ